VDARPVGSGRVEDARAVGLTARVHLSCLQGAAPAVLRPTTDEDPEGSL
jgi:hypothetical protein